MADRRYAPLKGALPGGTTVKESELTSGDQLAWDATNNTWAVSTALTLPTGTTTGAHLKWSGSAWVENTQLVFDGSTPHAISRASGGATTLTDRTTMRLIDTVGTTAGANGRAGIDAINSDGAGLGWLTWYDDNLYIRVGVASDETGGVGQDGSFIRLDGWNGTNNEILARFLIGGAAELYYDGTKVAETEADGIDLYAASGTAPKLKLFSAAATELIRLHGSANNLYLDNRVDSGELYIRGYDSTSTLRNMITLDPDGGIDTRGAVRFSGSGISNYCVLVDNGGTADSGDLDQASPGILMYAAGMNTTNRHTPAILFGSDDAEFTTTSPKTLAGIVGRAQETYSADNTGAMGIAFYITGATPGTAPTLTELGYMNSTGLHLPNSAGILFGSQTASSSSDNSKHISLFSTTYGINIIASTLDIKVPGSGQHVNVPVGGFTVGSPTGGNKGTGGINASAVYDDNTLLTCMPVEDALGRSNGRQEWDQIVGRQHPMLDQYEQDQADGYDGTAAGWRTLMEARGAVPGLLPKTALAERYARHIEVSVDETGTMEWEADNKPSVGEVSARMWLAMDYMAVALRDALNKIDELEARLNDDPSRNGQPGTTPTP